MKQITGDMKIYDVLKINPKAGAILQSFGMHCIGCAMARGETIEQAADVHGVDIHELVEKLNAES